MPYFTLSPTSAWLRPSDGDSKHLDYWKVVTPIYRAVDHGGARTVFQRIAKATSASPKLRALAEAFVDLQASRIRADYDPEPAFSRKDALMAVDLARQAVVLLRALPDVAKRLLIVQLISKQR